MIKRFKADKVLQKKCENLAYSRTEILDDATFVATKDEIQQLYAEYGIANVLGELSQQWDFEKAVPFFNKIYSQTKIKRPIKTIATFYRRAYNGGVEKVNAQLINMWVEAGYKVILITEEEPNDLDYFYPRDKVKRTIVPSFFNMPDRLGTFQKILTEEQVDIFVNHGWTNPSVLWECVLMKNLQIPYVLYAHGHFSHFYAANYALYYQIFRMTDLVVAISETNARFYQMCGCQTCLVQNPIPQELKNARQTADLNSHHILWVGRIAEGKRPLDAVLVLKKVREQIPDAELDIVGGAEKNFLEQMHLLSKDLGIFDAINFYGLHPENKMSDFYMNSALLLFTSESEGYPMTLLESKAFGIPCVMYSLPYLSLVKDGKGFLSAELGDINTMADHVIRLLKDDAIRKSLGQEAKESFDTLANYDLSGTWQKIFDFCEGKESEDKIFYMPDQLNESDKYIMPPLFDMLQKTAEKNSLTKNFDYKIGHKVLKIPREIGKIIKKIANIFARTKND